MKIGIKSFLLFVLMIVLALEITAQDSLDEDKLGAWYMYFWDKDFKESSWGLQGDIQYRNWNLGGDLEQLLLRGGVTYSPKETKAKFTLGYGHITSGEFGEGNETTDESRIYQEALIPQKIGGRFYLKHRFRYEQRFTSADILRTRYRYNLFLNVPLNKKSVEKKAIYLALYNELFINGQKNIAESVTVEFFDRNRLYVAFGYALKDNLKFQIGVMQQTTDSNRKNQFQLSVHHSF